MVQMRGYHNVGKDREHLIGAGGGGGGAVKAVTETNFSTAVLSA